MKIKVYYLSILLAIFSNTAFADFCYDGEDIGLTDFYCEFAVTEETRDFVCGDHPKYTPRWTKTVNVDANDIVEIDPIQSFHFGVNCTGKEIVYRDDQCEENVRLTVNSCKDTYFFTTTAAGVLCGRITWGIGATFCGAVGSALVHKAMNWCDVQGEKLLQNCPN
ncbi:hypothetical protein L1D51_07570 [Pseudoalteromonas shioyasakiensis]|uniref:hypothetical protein n=1 Tax=Pseudoalteromonas shioyasakiensis TaxID=1190813 RepID=UPI001EFD8802|nr:hypothetical protein [Pseudoalteromonas shioyasakiensis]MCG9733849.1 hypothetical protein [Pseudoalteromonas shioyasakiensis]